MVAVSPPAAPSSATPLVASGLGSVGVSPLFSRGDHVHPAQVPVVGAPNSRTISMATAYQATDITKPAIVVINLTSSASLTLSGGQTHSADMIIGETNAVAGGTGTVIGKYSNSETGTMGLGLGFTTIAATPNTFLIPAGWYFAVRTTSGTVTITSAFDQSMS